MPKLCTKKSNFGDFAPAVYVTWLCYTSLVSLFRYIALDVRPRNTWGHLSSLKAARMQQQNPGSYSRDCDEDKARGRRMERWRRGIGRVFQNQVLFHYCRANRFFQSRPLLPIVSSLSRLSVCGHPVGSIPFFSFFFFPRVFKYSLG